MNMHENAVFTHHLVLSHFISLHTKHSHTRRVEKKSLLLCRRVRLGVKVTGDFSKSDFHISIKPPQQQQQCWLTAAVVVGGGGGDGSRFDWDSFVVCSALCVPTLQRLSHWCHWNWDHCVRECVRVLKSFVVWFYNQKFNFNSDSVKELGEREREREICRVRGGWPTLTQLTFDFMRTRVCVSVQIVSFPSSIFWLFNEF